jgi:hypothetical protein
MSVVLKSFWLDGWRTPDIIASLNVLSLMMMPITTMDLIVMSHYEEVELMSNAMFSLVLNRNVVRLVLEPEPTNEMILR